MKGTVKWFNARRGYGFITGDDGADYYAHYTDINAEGFRTMSEGDAMTFDVVNEEKGARAVNICKVAS